MSPIIITLEGSIGAGKSTYLNALEAGGLFVVYEPVEEWSKPLDLPNHLNHNGSSSCNMFELFYNDKKKYGFLFQMMVLQTRVEHLMKALAKAESENVKIIITERCPLTDFHIFALLMVEKGFITECEFAVYNKWYKFAISILPPVSGVIYLFVDPKVCVNRIMKRNRNGEENIDLGYLQRLHEQHENWMKSIDLPVLAINGNGEIPSIDCVFDFVNLMPIN